LKETGGSLQGVLTVVSKAETKAIDAERRGIDVYVKAKSVTTMDMLNFAFKGPMEKIRNNQVLFEYLDRNRRRIIEVVRDRDGRRVHLHATGRFPARTSSQECRASRAAYWAARSASK